MWFNGGMDSNETTKTSARRATFTASAFERSHGKRPTGRGSWAFQQTTSFTAFDAELFGEIEFFNDTLTGAMARMRANGATGLWAILP